ncbi:hypothetical protein DFH06DRAFT_1237364 [Mycena polygramma]|nr:hypothetical protein DFH06DRAFT_1237364 [Mycena polygramma]
MVAQFTRNPSFCAHIAIVSLPMSRSYSRTASMDLESTGYKKGISPSVDFDGDFDRDFDGLVSSARSLLRESREPAYQGSQSPVVTALRVLSWILHLILVGIHLVLIFVWAKGLEQHVVFSLDNQKMASLLITGITTGFVTIYSALLVFVTQSLSIRRSLEAYQPLTATHDIAAAWTGIGSAAVHIWRQWAVPASPFGVLLAFLYLGGVIVLHVSTPALFALETFNATHLNHVQTQSLPSYTWPDGHVSWDSLVEYTLESLINLPTVLGNTTAPLGWQNGTLYDVLDYNAGTGNVAVDATGFNVTCGFVPDLQFSGVSQGRWTVTSPTNWGNQTVTAPSTQPGALVQYAVTEKSLFYYTTTPIVDSGGNIGHWVDLSPPMNSSISSIQFFRCSLSLVRQTAIVDSQSRSIITVEPDLVKTSSSWSPYSGPGNGSDVLTYGPDVENWSPPNVTVENPLIDAWARLYSLAPASNALLDTNTDDAFAFGVPDVYLIQKLNLNPFIATPVNVTLHDVENTISASVAAIFWTLGHNPPASQAQLTRDPSNRNIVTVFTEPVNPPFLLRGGATVTEIIVKARLESNTIAISVGLVTSIMLTILSLPSSLYRGHRKGRRSAQINGTGILDIIWLYRNHPELERLILPVRDPAINCLRQGGMVQTRLAAGRVRRREIF